MQPATILYRAKFRLTGQSRFLAQGAAFPAQVLLPDDLGRIEA
jgi:hypothetical protein